MSDDDVNRLLFTQRDLDECRRWINGGKVTTPMQWWFHEVVQKEGGLYWKGSRQIIPQEEIAQYLTGIYNNPRITGGRDRMYSYVKDNVVGVSRRAVMDFLRGQESYQLRYKVLKPKITRPIFSGTVNGHWQMDLVDFQRWFRVNRGSRYILVVVDVFSRYTWARPLKHKTGLEVRNGLSSIFEERRPLVLQSDNGLEFRNSEVRDLLNQWKIRQVFSKSYTPTTQGLVERFNQTLKSKIFNGFLRNNNKRWVDYLQDYVANMNDSFQTTIKAKPSDVQAQALVINSGLQKEVRQRLINRNIQETKHTPVFKRGQLVRIALSALTPYKRNRLSKPLLRWTNEVYPITKVLEVSPDQPWDSKRYIVNGEIYNGYQLQQV